MSYFECFQTWDGSQFDPLAYAILCIRLSLRSWSIISDPLSTSLFLLCNKVSCLDTTIWTMLWSFKKPSFPLVTSRVKRWVFFFFKDWLGKSLRWGRMEFHSGNPEFFFSFRNPAISLIMNCICSSRLAILVNREQTKFFRPF